MHLAAIALLLILSPSVSLLPAQTFTAPQGFCNIGGYSPPGTYEGLLAASDTMLSVPFTRPPEYTGTIQSVSADMVTVTGTPNWTINQFAYGGAGQPKTYYALLGPGPNGGAANPKEGCFYTITANGSSNVTLDLNGDVVTSIPPNATITIIPYWTLGTIFPAANAGISFTPTASTRSFQTEVLIPNFSGAGINLAYADTYYYLNNSSGIGWRLYGDATGSDHSNDVLMPNGYFVVRNQNGAPTLPFAIAANVLSTKLATPLATRTSTAQDNAVSVVRPISVSLNNTGLNAGDGSFAITTSTRSFQDELLLYNNNVATINKAPTATYYYMNGAWRLYGDASGADHGADLIPAGGAFTIRKSMVPVGNTVTWVNTPTYTNP